MLAEVGESHSPVQEPRPGVICLEANRDVVASSTDVHCVAADRVDIIVGCTACATNNVEGMLWQCISAIYPYLLTTEDDSRHASG